MLEKNVARAFWVREPGVGEVREVALPAVSDGEVAVRALVSAVSRGTESLVFRGAVPASLREDMRAPFQEGDFPAPLKYGYMSVGVVESAPGRPELLGRTVFCMYPHQDRYVVPAHAVVPVPARVPAERAVLAANAETALNAVWDAGIGPGDRVVVVGAGVVGLLVTRIAARIPGTEVIVVDPNPAREAVVMRFGAVWRSSPPPLADADVVVHASGTAAGARVALDCAGVESTVVELSWYGTSEVCLPLGEAFHPRRLTFKSSQVGRIPPLRAPRWTHRRRLEAALDLLDDPALDALFTGECALEALPGVMQEFAAGTRDALCHRVRYGT